MAATQVQPIIETSLGELAEERKALVDQRKAEKTRMDVIDEILRPILRQRREMDADGIAFSPTHEWRMQKDSVPTKKYPILKLIKLLEKAGIGEEDIELIVSKACAKVNEAALQVLTRKRTGLKGWLTRISKVSSARTGSLYERRRQ